MFGIEAPDSFEEALVAQDFVKSGDAAREIVGSVEEGSVGVCDFDTFTKKLGRGDGV